MTKAYLASRKPHHVAKLLINDAITDPEDWLQNFLQLRGYCLTTRALQKGQVDYKDWCQIWRVCNRRASFNYFTHTVAFSILRLGQKYLYDYEMTDEALKLAVKTQNMQLLKACRSHAKRKMDIVMISFIDSQIELVSPGSQ
jgi:hypothetical protein